MVSMQSALDYLLLLYIATTLLYTTKLDAWYYIHYITSLRNCPSYDLSLLSLHMLRYMQSVLLHILLY